MTTPFTIRPARDDDRDALVEQFQGLNQHEDLIVHNRRTDRAAGEESLVAAEVKVVEKNGVRLVAERDGKVVGHLFLTFEQAPIFVRREVRDYAYIAELFVREEARGLGIGRGLMQEAERIALARGVGHLMLGVLTGNESAERAYARFGFRSYATDLIKPIRKTP